MSTDTNLVADTSYARFEVGETYVATCRGGSWPRRGGMTWTVEKRTPSYITLRPGRDPKVTVRVKIRRGTGGECAFPDGVRYHSEILNARNVLR